MLLAIDFDGVICDLHRKQEGKRMGEPVEGALSALEFLHDNGHEVIVYTVKAATESGIEAVQDWLEHFGIDYSGITAVKPNCDVYIDDKALKFVNWPQVITELGIEEDD